MAAFSFSFGSSRRNQTGSPGIAGYSLFRKSSRHREKGFSGKAGKKPRKLGLLLFSLPFIGLGSVFFWLGGLNPLLRSWNASDWPEVPCRIDRSFVESHSDSDGTTYSVEIRFTYEWEGETYKGENYSLMSSSSSGRSSKQAIVRQYPEGSQATCFVNPEDPYDAVITVEVGWLPFAIMGFSSIFMVVGFVVFFAGLKPRKGVLPDPQSSLSGDSFGGSGPRELKPETGRVTKALGVTLFCLVWNGVVAGMFFGSRTDGGDTVLLVFSLVFGVIGLVAIGVAVRMWMGLLNPKPTIRVEPPCPRIGDTFRITWSMKGSISRLDNLAVVLEGSETARYQRGTTTVTDKNVFFQETLFETEALADFRSGTAQVELPVNAVPTFEMNHNEIEWHVIFCGAVRRWPDLRESYPLPVFAGRPLTND